MRERLIESARRFYESHASAGNARRCVLKAEPRLSGRADGPINQTDVSRGLTNVPSTSNSTEIAQMDHSDRPGMIRCCYVVT